MPSICDRCSVHQSTGWLYVKQRRELGPPAYHHNRWLSKVLGRNSRVSKATVDMLLSASRNPVSTQRLEPQIAYHDITVKRRQLATSLYTPGRPYSRGVLNGIHEEGFQRQPSSQTNHVIMMSPVWTLRTKSGSISGDSELQLRCFTPISPAP